MRSYIRKTHKSPSRPFENDAAQTKPLNNAAAFFTDNRPGSIAQRKLQEMAKNSRRAMQLKGLSNINTDPALEKEADVMGEKSLSTGSQEKTQLSAQAPNSDVKQFVVYANEAELWNAVEPGTPFDKIRQTIDANNALSVSYNDSLVHLNRMNFVEEDEKQPEASTQLNIDNTYDISYGLRSTQKGKFTLEEVFIGAIIHEMNHVASGLQYNTNVGPGEYYHVANMHLPVGFAPFFDGTQIGKNQATDPVNGWNLQKANMITNWTLLGTLRTNDHGFTAGELQYLRERETYATNISAEAHYDPVLADILYFLQHRGLFETHYYLQATAMLHEANTRRIAGNGVVPVMPLVPQPPNDFLALYDEVHTLLNDQRWNKQGKWLFLEATPAGVKEMRKALNANSKRDSLNTIRQIALRKRGEENNNRSLLTSELYDILTEVDRRSGFGELIDRLAAFNLKLENGNEDLVEMQ